MEKLASKREQTLWSADRPLLQVILPLQPQSATLMVSVAAVRRNQGLRNTGIRAVATRKNVFKIKTGWGCHSFVWKTKKRNKQKTRTGSHRIIMPEFPQMFILETQPQSTIVFIKNTESNQEKCIVIFTFKLHAYLLGTMAPFLLGHYSFYD